MTPGFRALLGGQFLSALADNAVLVIAIAALDRLAAPGWMTPMLKFVFIGSFVVFAVGVGAFADRMPKARVMLLTNAVKGAGCLLLLAGMHPLAAYAVVGLGAAAQSPAKYGLLTELAPVERLVAANGWLEGLTIAAVIIGTLLGGMLVGPGFARATGGAMTAPAAALPAAIVAAFALYVVAAAANLLLPRSSRRDAAPAARPAELVGRFARALLLLATDPAGRVALLATSVLWGAGATLQFVVIDWGRGSLGLPLDRAAMLPGAVALGVALGAVLAARSVRLPQAFSILPLAVVLGPMLLALLPVTSLLVASALLLLAGVAAGVVLVPMNATLQHRGVALTNAGQAIAVQNFCENLSVMAMVAGYAALVGARVPLAAIVVALAAGISIGMFALHRHATQQLPPAPQPHA